MLKITDTANSSSTLPPPSASPHSSSYQSHPVTDVNLNHNLSNTIEDDYYRFTICFWRISYGWLDFLVTISTVTTTLLGTLATLGQLDDSTRRQLGIACLATGSLSVLSQSLKVYANRAIKTSKTMLKEVIVESTINSPDKSTDKSTNNSTTNPTDKSTDKSTTTTTTTKNRH